MPLPMHHATQELRQAARRLRRAPGFTAVVVLTLAVGIGGTTALFSVVHSVLLRSLPYPEPDRLVRIFDTNRELSIEKTGVATGNLLDWRKGTQGFSAMGGWYVMGRTLRTEQDVEVVRSAQVTEGFFPALNVQPALGRIFSTEEIARSVFNNAAAPVGADVVIVISHRLWRGRFGGDPAVLDKTVFVDRHPMRVVGVMPADFSFPNTDIDVWVPWGFRENPPKDQRYVKGIARIAPGHSIAQAEAALQSVAAQLATEFPAQNKGWSPMLVPLQEELTGASRPTLLLLFGAVCCVMLIGSVNVAHLQLIRASQFARETAVRVALGASRARLLQQFGAESLLLSLAGGASGILLAAASLQWLRLVQPAQLPRASEVSLHFTALLFAAGVTLLAGIAAGFAPALGAARTQLTQSLNEGGRSGGAGKAAQHFRNGLVVAEIAAAVVLLVSAGLLGRSFMRLLAVDPGFNYRNVLVLPIFLDNHEYTSGPKVRAYYAQLMSKLASLPGVVSVGGATALPASPLGPDFERPVWAEGTAPLPHEALRADVRMIMPDYFRTLGISVLRGRAYGAEDSPEAPRRVIVNEMLASRIWPGEDPIGKQLVMDYSTAGTHSHLVVGVVSNLRFYGLRSEPQPELYLAHAQRSYLVMNIALRASGDPRALIPAVRRVALEIDAGQPPQSIRPLEELVRDTVAQDQLATGLFVAFSATALFLAMLGIYGVMAYRVAQRTNEIGIRMALGAQPQQVLHMILGGGLSLAAVGGALGLLLALGAARLLQSQLFGVAPADPLTYATVPLFVALTTLLACWFPARRAARVDPVEALRHS